MEQKNPVTNIPRDFKTDESIILAQYLLSPDVPPSQREYFDRVSIAYSKIMALGNIERQDILTIIQIFKQIKIFNKMRLYSEARDMAALLLVVMQSTRSIGALWTLYGQQGIQRKEEIQRVFDNRPKESRGSFMSMFRRKKEQTQQPGDRVGMERGQ